MASQSPTPPAVRLADGRQLTPVELRARVRQAGTKNLDETSLCELLVVNGVVGLEDLSEFIIEVRRAGVSVPAYAAMTDLLDAPRLTEMVARAYQLEPIDLDATAPDPELAGLIDAAHRQRLGVLAVGRDGDGALVVAIADPSDTSLREQVAALVGGPVVLRLARPGQVERLIGEAAAARAEGQDRLVAEAASQEALHLDIRVSGAAADSATVNLVNAMITQAREHAASDIHVEPSDGPSWVRFRIDGVLQDVRQIPRHLHEQVVSRIKVLADLKIDEKRSPQDGRTSFKTPAGVIELRVATLPTVFGERVTMRLLDPATARIGLEHLGFSGPNLQLVRDAITRPWGMILSTGPTGSGKSTTLYALLHAIASREKNIITVEDPVEQRVPGISQIQVAERASLTFASSLRSILRSDPDVIMIGEIRDQETAKISVEAAMTGHLVLSTLHTNSAASAVTRLMEMGVEPFLISDAAQLIMAQRLARVLCRYCRQERSADAQMLRTARAPRWAIERAEAEGPIAMWKARQGGCARCRGTGYAGRVGVHEVMAVDDEIRELIMRVASAEELAQAAVERGMTTLREDGFAKVLEGTTSLEELARVVS